MDQLNVLASIVSSFLTSLMPHCCILFTRCAEFQDEDTLLILATWDVRICGVPNFPYGLVVRIPAFHAGGPGSIPGVGESYFALPQIIYYRKGDKELLLFCRGFKTNAMRYTTFFAKRPCGGAYITAEIA